MNWEKQNVSNQVNIQTTLFLDLTDEDQNIVSLLRQFADGIQLNELAIKLEMPVSKVSAMLLELEFKGILKCLPGSVYKIVK
jgi:DNA processing protein